MQPTTARAHLLRQPPQPDQVVVRPHRQVDLDLVRQRALLDGDGEVLEAALVDRALRAASEAAGDVERLVIDDLYRDLSGFGVRRVGMGCKFNCG